MKNRRKARELTLQVLYACEIDPETEPLVLNEYLAEENGVPLELRNYSRDLLKHTRKTIPHADELIQKYAANWKIERLASIDRNILRMAITELLHFEDVPVRVVMDEAVEIAKEYGTDDSGKFVNGVIDAIYQEVKKDMPQR